MDPTLPRPPSPWIAVFLGLICNGLGHVYSRRIALGLGIFGAWLLLGVAWAFGLRGGLRPALAGLITMLLFGLVQAVHAGVAARRSRDLPRRWLSRPVGLTVLFLAATGVNWAWRPLMRAAVVQTWVMPSGGMLPTLEIGDYFVSVPGMRIDRGAIVLYQHEGGGRSESPYVHRVVAIAGDTVEVRDGRLVLNGAAVPGEELSGNCTYFTRFDNEWRGEPCRARTETIGEVTYRILCAPDRPCGDVPFQRVPPGHVFLLGDHRDNAADSRVFGPVRERAILGRARWALFSWGPEGLRNERSGIELR